MKYEVKIIPKNPYDRISEKEKQEELYLAEARMNIGSNKVRFHIIPVAEYDQRILDDPAYGI